MMEERAKPHRSGRVDGLISMPLSSHSAVPPQERARLGIKDPLVRPFVGIEDITDDLDQALRSKV
jgi:cystathionine gamma-lyase